MATEKLYLHSSALTGDAIVTGLIDGERKVVRLSRTLFHPQGGGQRADVGTIGGVAVLDVRHAEGGEVDHVVADFGALKLGSTVAISIDGAKRLLHARIHSAGHMIADAAVTAAPNLVAKSGHHWPAEGRVEFEGEVADTNAFVAALQAEVDRLIAADLPVAMLGDPNSSRQIQIGNGLAVGCGGTHVASLAQLEQVTIRKVQQKKGVLRVSYGVGGEV